MHFKDLRFSFKAQEGCSFKTLSATEKRKWRYIKLKKSLIYITNGITFQDLKDNKVKKSEIYEKQMGNWFIKPSQLLLESSRKLGNYEQELPLLMLLITFFESHGQYLLGTSSQGGSCKVFKYGFNAYLEYLVSFKNHNNENYENIDHEKFYSLVRCGLLHNGYIKSERTSFFIDRYKMDKIHVIYPNRRIEDSWLINTHNMLNGIKEYLSYYINMVETDDEYKVKFEKMFDTFFSID